MRNRLSIFSSRILGSALIWTVLAIALIEWHAQRALPARHPSHEVDRLLQDLDCGRIPAGDTVFLGDSVGRQIARALLHHVKVAPVPLASNAAIETPGQFFVLRRYLEHHPAPQRAILMMGNPVEGDLQGDFTENYFQRGFLRWREIAEIAWTKRSPSFSLVMVAYKLFPTFRYRASLQQEVPLVEAPDPTSGRFEMAAPSNRPKATTGHGLLNVMAIWHQHHRRSPQIAETYFLRLASFLEDRGIEWIYLPLPVPESASGMIAPYGFYGHQVRCVLDLSASFPSMHIYEEFLKYPDDQFRDGVHFDDKFLLPVVEEHIRILSSLGFPLARR